MDPLEERIDWMEERLLLRIEISEARTARRLAELKAALLEQMCEQAATFTRSTVIATVSSVIAMGGLIFGARLV